MGSFIFGLIVVMLGSVLPYWIKVPFWIFTIIFCSIILFYITFTAGFGELLIQSAKVIFGGIFDLIGYVFGFKH
jgi:ABC-type Mn2+/Zn2+ transport system permease subunit